MQDLQTFYDWMISSAQKGESTAYHYKSGLSACSKDFLAWNLTDKPLMEMSLSELDIAIQKAFLSSLFIDKNTRGNNMYSNSLKQYRNFLAVHNALLLDTISHIRPWAVSTNEQRLSSENGLLLSPLYDKLFDVGLITFSNDGQIVCSKELENKNIDLLKINRNRKYDLKISSAFVENLRYHQNTVFLGGA